MKFYGIVPPHIFKEIAQRGSMSQKECAFNTLAVSEQFRGRRSALAGIAGLAAVPTGGKRRTIYDAKNRFQLPGRLVRGEGDRDGKDAAVNEAYAGAGVVYDFYENVYARNSLDGRGARLDGSVHYGRDYDNAFWNGHQMVYGDGDGEFFGRFTGALDVIGHELTHGVVQFEADLAYQDQSGALNESFADIFGSLIKQYANKQKAGDADWLVGEGLFTSKVKGRALRSLKNPGTAYDDPILGRDPQPAHMRDYVRTSDDNGGVHINSGIPNKAFYETAARLGGYAWQKTGRIWYVALTEKLSEETNFEQAARLTVAAAQELFGVKSPEQEAVQEGWAGVGIRIKTNESSSQTNRWTSRSGKRVGA
ncbi:MAG: M4 family metallopeptidase [Elusimicrobia bacterium]|nr:M4 family metallopeptidase [Elusimicrobiota bacterium]